MAKWLVLPVCFALLSCDDPSSADDLAAFAGTYDFTMMADPGFGSSVFGSLIIQLPDRSGEFTGTLSYRFVSTPGYGGEDDLNLHGEISRERVFVFNVDSPGAATRVWVVSGQAGNDQMAGRWESTNGSLQYKGAFSATRR